MAAVPGQAPSGETRANVVGAGTLVVVRGDRLASVLAQHQEEPDVETKLWVKFEDGTGEEEFAPLKDVQLLRDKKGNHEDVYAISDVDGDGACLFRALGLLARDYSSCSNGMKDSEFYPVSD